MRLRKLGVAAAALATVGSAGLYGAGPASAVTTTKYVSDNCDFMNCPEGELFINYHSVAVSGEGNPSGSFASFYGDIEDHAGTYVTYNGGASVTHYIYVFASGEGDGSGQLVKNNAASANNCSTVDGYRIYYNSGYAGHSQAISHAYGCGSSINLDATLKNNNASSHFA